MAALIILDDMGAHETDMMLTIIPLAGEKRTLRVPLTQYYEPSDIHCLRLLVAWPALHAH